MSRVQHRVIRLKHEERAKGGDVRSEVFEDGGALAEVGVGGIEARSADVESVVCPGVWMTRIGEEESVMERKGVGRV